MVGKDGLVVAYLTGTALEEMVASSQVKINGDREAVTRFGAYLDPLPDASRILVTLHGPAGEHAQIGPGRGKGRRARSRPSRPRRRSRTAGPSASSARRPGARSWA